MDNPDGRILFRVGLHAARLLSVEEDGPSVQRFCEACCDYYELVGGRPPGVSAAHDLFTDGPPDKSLDDKFVIGVFVGGSHGTGDHLLGLLEGFRDFPEPGDWWLGLAMLHPDERGRGLGEALMGAFRIWAAGEGAVGLGLGVSEHNPRALRFWRGQGFEAVRTTDATMIGERPTRVIVMRRGLGAGRALA